DTVRGAPRVHGGRRGVPARLVPIGAPLVNVLAQVEEAVPVRFAPADRFGTIPPTAGVRGGQCVAPGVEALLEPAAGGEFPLRLGGQADRQIPLAGKPRAVSHGIAP